MNRPARPPSNRQRVEDYYGVHETGIGARPAPRPAAPQPDPARPPSQSGQQVPLSRVTQGGQAGLGAQSSQVEQPGPAATGRRVIPPPEEQVAAKAGRSKPDPLTDPLTSKTFDGVAPEPDTFSSGATTAGVTGDYGYSATPPPRAPSSGFDGEAFDPFAPPKFEPPTFERAGGPGPVGAPSGSDDADPAPSGTADTAGTLDEPDESYIDVEVVDVVEVSRAAPTLPEPLALDPFPYTPIDESYVDEATLENLHTPHLPEEPGAMTDFNESLSEAMNIDGALGVALVDAGSGMALATAGDPSGFNLEVAAAGNSALVQAMGRTLGDMDLDDHIEDILITLGTQYQIVRPIRQGTDDLFLYLVLDRSRANLAMARFRLTKLAETIEV